MDDYCLDKFGVYPIEIRFYDNTYNNFAISLEEFDKIYLDYLSKVSTINMQNIWN